MKNRIFITLMAILILLSTSSLADQYNLDFEGRVDVTISDIATGGLWKDGKSYGNYRIIVRSLGWEHTRSFLYLQWLKTDDEKNEVIELLTIPIPEFNTGQWKNVQKVEYQDDCFYIYYIVRGQEGIGKATLKPNLPNKYLLLYDKNE